MQIESPAFAPKATIPYEFTCDGEDASPPLIFKDIPAGTVSLALIMEDPDAPRGTFDHWIAWNIPPDTVSLVKGYTPPTEGLNGFHETNYRGPCPPAGAAHRYFFKLFALDIILSLPVGSLKSQLEKEMHGHILGKAELVGTYQRKS